MHSKRECLSIWENIAFTVRWKRRRRCVRRAELLQKKNQWNLQIVSPFSPRRVATDANDDTNASGSLAHVIISAAGAVVTWTKKGRWLNKLRKTSILWLIYPVAASRVVERARCIMRFLVNRRECSASLWFPENNGWKKQKQKNNNTLDVSLKNFFFQGAYYCAHTVVVKSWLNKVVHLAICAHAMNFLPVLINLYLALSTRISKKVFISRYCPNIC